MEATATTNTPSVAALTGGDRSTLYAYLVLRMIVAAFVVGAGVMIGQVTDGTFSVRPLYLLLGLSTVTGGLAYAVIKLGMDQRRTLWALMLSDILIETAIVHFSGGVSGQFASIFCLTIVAAAFLLEMPGGLATSMLASLCFVTYGVLDHIDMIAPPGGVADAGLNLLRLYMHVTLFFLVGAVGGHLAGRMRSKGQELRSAENELKQLRVDTDYILNNMSSGIVVTDVDGVVVTVNPAAEQILGVERNDVLLKTVGAAFGDRAPDLTRSLEQALATKSNRFRHEILIDVPGRAQKTPLGTSISLMRDSRGDIRGAISVFQDLSEVYQMRDRVRKADRLAAIGELSASIAHELRNPLASISGSIEMLASELELEDEHGRLMQLITRESDRLDHIIGDFLEFARLRPPYRERMTLTDPIEDVVMLLKNNPKSNKVGISVHGDTEVLVKADDEQLRQVFTSIGVNACEAMSDGGSLAIRVEQREHEVAVRFEDEGPGIAAEDQERLFEPFFTTKEGGTGLGLAIAHRIVEAHGGTIEYRNRESGGAAFDVIIPTASPRATQAPEHQEPALSEA